MSKMHIAKRDIDRAKRAKAAEKRQRRQGSGNASSQRSERPPATNRSRGLSDRELLARIEDAHHQLESGAIDQEQFDAIKSELLSLLNLG